MMAAAEWLQTGTIIGPAPCPRQGHAVAVNGEEIYLFGGSSSHKSGEGIIFHDDFFRLCVSGSSRSCKWTQLQRKGHTPCRRDGHSMCLHGNQLYIYGGKNQITARVCLPGLYVYDIGTGIWAYLPTLGVAPSSLGHSVSCVGDVLYVYGGYMDGTVTDHLYILHLRHLNWTRVVTSGGIPARCDHAAAVVANDIYIFGGCAGKDMWLNDLQVLNTDTLSWKKVRSTGGHPLPRGCHSLVAHITKELYLFGGTNDSLYTSGTTFNDLYKYNMLTSEWSRPVCSGPACTKRYGHSALLIGSTMYVLYGINNLGELSDVNILKLTQAKQQSDLIDSGTNLSAGTSHQDEEIAGYRGRHYTESKDKASVLKSDAREALEKILGTLDDKFDQLEQEKRHLESERKTLDKEKTSCEHKMKELNRRCHHHQAAALEWLELREHHNKMDRENINKQRKKLLGEQW